MFCLFVGLESPNRPRGKEAKTSHAPNPLGIGRPDPFSAPTCHDPTASLQPRAYPKHKGPTLLLLSLVSSGVV